MLSDLIKKIWEDEFDHDYTSSFKYKREFLIKQDRPYSFDDNYTYFMNRHLLYNVKKYTGSKKLYDLVYNLGHFPITAIPICIPVAYLTVKDFVKYSFKSENKNNKD